MTSIPPRTLVLSLRGDPQLTRLAGIVTTHFLRQNGLTLAAARRGARVVERRCLGILRAAARRGKSRGAALRLVLRPHRGSLEVIGRPAGGQGNCLVRLALPDPA